MSQKLATHTVSIELHSRSHLNRLSFCNEADSALVEGALGRIVSVTLRDDILLEVEGENGVLRLDIDKDELGSCLVKRDMR